MDQGLPIAYQMLADGVPVQASDGQQVGTVVSVLGDLEADIFHGLLIDTPHRGVRFLEADAVTSIYENRVDLGIDSAAAENLPAPEHPAPEFGEQPDRQQQWRHWLHRLTGRGDWTRKR